MLAVFWNLVVDLVHFNKREVTLPLFGSSNFAFNGVPCVEIKSSDLGWANVNVIWTR